MGLITGELSLTVLRDRPEVDWQVQSWAWTGGPVALLLPEAMALEDRGPGGPPAPGARLQLGPYRCLVLERADWLDAVYVGRQGRIGDGLAIAVWRAQWAAGEWNARLLRQLARWGLAVPEEAASRTWLDVRPLWDLRQALRRRRFSRAHRKAVEAIRDVSRAFGEDLTPVVDRAVTAIEEFGRAADTALVQATLDAADAAGITFEQALERIQVGIEQDAERRAAADAAPAPDGWTEVDVLGPPFVAGPDGELEMPELRAEIRKDGE
jgi:hypothetical protein